MAKRKQGRRKPSRGPVGLKPVGPDAFELVPPPCVRERADDVAEVREMLAAGEIDLARDELRWLLEGCPDFIEVHVLLGDLAWGEERVDLARGHYGYAHSIGRRALGSRFRGRLPYERAANRPLFEAGAGLARALVHLGRTGDACRVLEEVLSWDSSDPLDLRETLEALRQQSAN